MTVKLHGKPIHAVRTPLVLVDRLQHLAVRCDSINRFKEISDRSHVQHEEQCVGGDGRALFCPIRIVGERGASNVGHQRHPSVGREGLELREGVGQGEGLAPSPGRHCSRAAAASAHRIAIIITPV